MTQMGRIFLILSWIFLPIFAFCTFLSCSLSVFVNIVQHHAVWFGLFWQCQIYIALDFGDRLVAYYTITDGRDG